MMNLDENYLLECDVLVVLDVTGWPREKKTEIDNVCPCILMMMSLTFI